MNAIYESSTYGEIVLKIGLPPSTPGKPVSVAASYVDQTIDLTWLQSETNGGWPILTFEIWVDDGAGAWPGSPISLDATAMDLNNLSYQVSALTGGLTYGVKITATNAINTSVESVTQYFTVADLPDAPTNAPTLETATETSISIAWNPPANNGGSSISGYRVYMNHLKGGDWKLVYDGKSFPSVVVYTQQDLIKGDHYRFRVSALNVRGESGFSPEDTFLCAAHPQAPS